jgi:hypothetical protein
MGLHGLLQGVDIAGGADCEALGGSADWAVSFPSFSANQKFIEAIQIPGSSLHIDSAQPIS